MTILQAAATLKNIADNIEKIIIGKRRMIELALIAIVAGGHVLVEDIPGVGKTKLVSSFARSIDCSFKRIQFTADTLPSDVTGFSMYNPKTMDFNYKKGAVLHQFVQADEINRASSRTQASLLEVMEERQVTVDGVTYKAPAPFTVFATQNPVDCAGTHPLPESQLDRFFMCISLGYPKRNEEIQILLSHREKTHLVLNPVASVQELISIQSLAADIFISSEVAGYIVDISTATRNCADVELGASPRASIQLSMAAKASALFHGRDFVTPDDVQNVVISVLSHRIFLSNRLNDESGGSAKLLVKLIQSIPVPVL